MENRSWVDLIDVDPPKVGEVTAEALEQLLANRARFRGSMRLATGRLWLDRAFEDWRRKVLSTPLP